MIHFAKVFLIFCLIFVACGSQNDNSNDSNLPQILVLPKCTVNPYWQVVKSGADSAGKEFGAKILWKGPVYENDSARQIQIIQESLEQGIDAIVLAANDTSEFTGKIRQIVQQKVPIITIDTELECEQVSSHISIDNGAAAEKAADVMAQLLNYKGKIAVIPSVPREPLSDLREQGFLKGIKKFENIQVVAIHYSQDKVAIGMAVTEDILTAHPDIDGFFAGNGASAIGVVQALKNKNKSGAIKVVSCDASRNEILALKKGFLDALITPDPFKMGYLGVKVALELLDGKKVAKQIETSVFVVTQENLDMAVVDSLGI